MWFVSGALILLIMNLHLIECDKVWCLPTILDGITFQKTTIVMFTAVRTSDLTLWLWLQAKWNSLQGNRFCLAIDLKNKIIYVLKENDRVFQCFRLLSYCTMILTLRLCFRCSEIRLYWTRICSLSLYFCDKERVCDHTIVFCGFLFLWVSHILFL